LRQRKIGSLDQPEISMQADRDAVIRRGDEDTATGNARREGDGVSQGSRIGKRADAKNGARAAMQHHPILNTLSSEKSEPASFTHP
jgi:hypothetical protein